MATPHDPDVLAAVIPAPMEIIEPVIKFESIKMPDSTGFVNYTEAGQVIRVRFRNEHGGDVHQMFLNDHPPIANGRELCGFPKKLAEPELRVEKNTIGGVVRFGSVPVAVATMRYKHRTLPPEQTLAMLAAPSFPLKIIPNVDGSPRICKIVRYFCEDITVKGAGQGPCGLALFHHAPASVAAFPVHQILSGVHILSGMKPGLGTVVHDYLDTRKELL